MLIINIQWTQNYTNTNTKYFCISEAATFNSLGMIIPFKKLGIPKI